MFSVRFKVKELKKVVEFSEENGSKIMLVRDEGIYILSSVPGKKEICYGESIDEVYGDDFCDSPPIKEWLEHQVETKPYSEYFKLHVTEDDILLIED